MAANDPKLKKDALNLPPRTAEGEKKPRCPPRLNEYRAEIKEWIATEPPGIFLAKKIEWTYAEALTAFCKYMGWKPSKYPRRTLNIWGDTLTRMGYVGVQLFVVRGGCCVLVLNIGKAREQIEAGAG